MKVTRFEALKALDDIFNYCEEIDYSLPENERSGYKMLPDVQKIRKYIIENTRPHGEWIKADRRIGFRFQEGLYICSLCENVVAVEECIAEPIYNFCPHCGAPMTEEALREYNGLKEGETK